MIRTLLQRLGAVALFLGLAAAAPAAAQTGTIEGRVTDQSTQQPLANAQVTLGGTTRGALTGADGRFRIENAPTGQVEVRVRYIGYALTVRMVTVRANETTTADFAISPSAVGLDAVVVTASGEQRTKEVANAVSTIQAEDIAQYAAPADVGDLLAARTPGLNVQQSAGTTGSGTRLRIRGSNSLSLSNEPVVIIDGVRVNNNPNATTVGVGGQATSRLDDLNPDDIESVDVIRGPSAAALYGTAAANGVVQIRTRRGVPGQTRWQFYYENVGFSDVTDLPANYRGIDSTGTGIVTCALRNTSGVATPCTQDAMRAVNPLENASPFQRGARNQIGGNVSGGNEGLTYYVSGEYEDEEGIYSVNNAGRYHLRANLAAVVSPKATVTVSTGYTNSKVRLPENDNNSFGIIPSGLLGRTDTINSGWGFLTPSQSQSILTQQTVDRFTGSVNIDWRPLGWLETQAIVGTDVTSSFDEKTFFPGEIPAAISVTAFEGSRTANRVQRYNVTATLMGKAYRALTSSVRSTTTVGMQYFRDYNSNLQAFGRKLVAGNNSLGGTVVPAVNEATDETILFGGFIEELIGINDRLFLTAAVRGDRNSSVGQNLDQFEFYPKLGASWVVSEEGFFPQTGFLSSLRLRAAFGQALLQPGTTAAVQFYNPVAITDVTGDVPGFTFGSLGNADLKPERTREIELGFDADLVPGRAHFEFTYYDKNSRDALIARRLPPSGGVSVTQFENLGEVSNKGVEILLNVTPVRQGNVIWDVTASAWGNKNRLIELGEDISPIVFGLGGASQRHQEGYPLGGFWFVPFTYADANNDGVIQTAEITNGTAPTFIGTPYPSHGGALSTTVTLSRRVRLYANFDGRFGHHLFNSTEEFRCGFGICRGLHDPSTSLADQARSVAAGVLGNDVGFVEDASFVKLRELSVTYLVPERFAGRVGAKGLSVTLAGRNLATWTDYTGFDPEISGGAQANFNQFDFLSQAPVPYIAFRINATY